MTPTEAVQQYTPMVRSIVAKWIRRSRHLKSFREDLTQDGFEGLLFALSQYKPGKGTLFSFAYCCANQHIGEAAFRYGRHTYRSLYKWSHVKEWQEFQELDDSGAPLEPDALLSTADTHRDAETRELAGKLKRKLNRLKRSMGARDVDIYTRRIGSDGDYKDSATGTAIGAEYGLSRSRVQQIDAKISKRVRAWGEKILKEVA